MLVNFCYHNFFRAHIFPLQNVSFMSVLTVIAPMPACAVSLTQQCCILSWAFHFKEKEQRCLIRESAAVSASSSQIETIQVSDVLIRCGKSILASLFSRMQNESVVTLHNVYCLPPIFPEMWRGLEAFEAWMPAGRWTVSIWAWSACMPNCATAETGRSKADAWKHIGPLKQANDLLLIKAPLT